jgi:hypothetical protein
MNATTCIEHAKQELQKHYGLKKYGEWVHIPTREHLHKIVVTWMIRKSSKNDYLFIGNVLDEDSHWITDSLEQYKTQKLAFKRALEFMKDFDE